MSQDPDVALKLLHTADWHLGMRFPAFSPEHQRTLMRARMDVLDNVFGAAESAGVDAVLCAGDLFDDPLPADAWWQGLLAKLQARDWSQRPVFLLPGNHDPLTDKSVWAEDHPFRRGLPEGVHVVDRDDFEAPLSPDAVLLCAPCRSRAGQTGLWRSIPRREDGDERIRVGMIHGQTFDIDGFQNSFPIPADAAEDRGLDYLAIGDTHAFREVPPEAAVPTVYPSAPEPTKFGEVDAGYVALVFFPHGGRRALLRRERVGRWRWVERTVRSVADLQALAAEGDLATKVMRLHVHIDATPPEYERVEQLLRTLGGTDATHGRVGVLQVDRAGFRLRTDDLQAAFDGLPESLAEVVSRLQAQAESGGEDAEAAKRAVYHLYRAVRGGDG
ncbi:MAG: exonuclease SbcCD subunit D [Nannocystaceae bacterium]|nr:metallophosphoesterase [bacterium]